VGFLATRRTSSLEADSEAGSEAWSIPSVNAIYSCWSSKIEALDRVSGHDESPKEDIDASSEDLEA